MAEVVNPSLNPSLSGVKAPSLDASLVNPLDQIKNQQPEQGSDLIKNIVTNETATGDQNILGDAPELDRSLIQDIEPPKSILLLLLKIFFGIIFVGSLASVAFFTSQLTATFDFATKQFDLPNVSKLLSSTNSEIIGLQTDLNLYRYLEIKGSLDKFSYEGDSYLQNYDVANSQTSSSTDKKEADEALVKLKADLKESLKSIRENFSKPFAAPLIDINYQEDSQLDTLYQEKLRSALQEKANSTGNSADSDSKKNLRTYMQAINLVGKDNLKNLLIKADFDALSNKELYEFIENVNNLVINDLSTIQAIKAARIKWADIIDEIDSRTKAVDKDYTEDFYDELGGIRYTNYDFETEERKIVIVGETKKSDTTNFTLIADLIDELNESTKFENAEMRSFSKSGSLDEGYVATLKMAFNLQEDVMETKDEKISPDEVPEFNK